MSKIAPRAALAIWCAILSISTINAEHLVHSTAPDYVAVIGLIRDLWLKTCYREGGCGANGPLGKPLSDERDVPGGNGRFSEFERGQILWSPPQKMVIAAYNIDAGIKVDWKITDQYNYDYFLVRWDLDEKHEECGTFLFWDTQTSPESCYQQEANGTRTQGSYVIPKSVGSGQYEIIVEGCDKGGFLRGAKCRQGWTDAVRVERDFLDVTHAPGSPPRVLPIAETSETANTVRRDRMLVAARAICNGDLGDLSEAFGDMARARFEIASADQEKGCGSKAKLEVSRAIVAATINAKVGTSIEAGEAAGIGAGQGAVGGVVAGAVVGCFFGPVGCVVGGLVGALGGGAVGAGVGLLACTREGDYDMTLMSLMPIAMEYVDQLEPQAQNKLLQEILNQTGGSGEVRTSIRCGLITIDETENHVLMTETARYLTNQLRWRGVRSQPQVFPTDSADYERLRKLYDNETNGMETWILQRLQQPLQADFHEYNARPYARLSMRALHNLADYDQSSTRRVKTAATLVLDYLSAKFAASSQDLRRAAPFRRRAGNADFNAFFGNHSDEETWHFLALAGNTRALEFLHYGRADWGAKGQLVFAGASRYQLPDLILDLLTDDSEDFSNRTFDATPLDRSPNQEYVQAFRHEGAEIYAGDREFLISGGGVWRPSGPQDKVLGFSGKDTEGQAFATFLIPRGQGVSRSELVRIAGDSNRKSRQNLCVTLRFACGLNPYVPEMLYRRLAKSPEPCARSTVGLISEAWLAHGGAAGWLGCPVSDELESSEGNGRFQQFERGTIAWSRPQKLVTVATYSKSANGIVIEWRITDQYNYDFFIVRWDRDGQNVGQHDVNSEDTNATRTSGNWTVPSDRPGKYRIVIEGCDGSFLSSSRCRQSWSIPVFMDFPSPAACVQVKGQWTFVDGSARCGSEIGPGYYSAVFSSPCGDGSSCKGQNYGFFEAISADDYPFQKFMTDVLQRNGGRQYAADQKNTYTRIDGREVVFTPSQTWGSTASGILGGDPDVPPSLNDWGLARGSFVEADGKGCVIVKNRVRGKALVLNMHDAANPQRTETDWQAGRELSCTNIDLPFGPDTCKSGFVWREAFEGDHVCVTPETRSQTATDNSQASGRRSPYGGPFGPDTCLQGFVWREARPSDHVCVPPATRQQAADDNSVARSRRIVP